MKRDIILYPWRFASRDCVTIWLILTVWFWTVPSRHKLQRPRQNQRSAPGLDCMIGLPHSESDWIKFGPIFLLKILSSSWLGLVIFKWKKGSVTRRKFYFFLRIVIWIISVFIKYLLLNLCCHRCLLVVCCLRFVHFISRGVKARYRN